jgi:hypothetical protein
MRNLSPVATLRIPPSAAGIKPPKADQVSDKFCYYPIRRRGTSRNACYIFAENQSFIKSVPIFKMIRLPVHFLAKLSQPAGIGAFQAAKHKHYIHLLAQLHSGFLPLDCLFAQSIDHFQLAETPTPYCTEHFAKVLRTLGGLTNDA